MSAGPAAAALLLVALMGLVGCGPGGSRPRVLARAPAPAACASAQGAAPAGPAGVSSADPVWTLARGLDRPDDVLFANGSAYVGEYGSGKIAVISPGAAPSTLPVTIPEVEGMALVGGTLYAADQQADTVVSVSGARVATVLRLAPIAGQEGVDGIAAIQGNLLVPDSPRGRVLTVTTSGRILASEGGFDRPTGVWPLGAGGFLLADEYAGRVEQVPQGGGAVTTRARGVPLVDDVARTSGGVIEAISLQNGTLLQVSPAPSSVLARGLAQPQGLGLDGAGNPLVTEYGAGRLDEVITTFQPLPPGPEATLSGGQPLCVDLLRGPGFSAAVAISPGAGYRVVRQPGAGDQGEVLPSRCARGCRVTLRLSSGTLAQRLALPYRRP